MSATTPTQLQPLRIGNLEIGFPVVQAALSGYSDWPMRVIARRHGASYTICEVMLDQFLVQVKDRRKNKHFLHISEEERPVGGQLMGSEPKQFAEGAKRLVAAGFDVIDINFGCPVKKVLGRCRGGYHLSQPSVALEIIRRTRDVVPPRIPVTVKMRRGIDDTPESQARFFEILQGAWQAGVSAVTIHGRTVEQRYRGPSRWDFLREVRRAFPDQTILGSGDLFTAADCLRMIQTTGVNGVTVARGAIGNPWIFRQAFLLAETGRLPPPPSVGEQRAVLEQHWRLAEQLYGDSRAGRLMRKFGIKYAASHPQYEAIRSAFAQVRGADDWWRVLERWYSHDVPGCYPPTHLHASYGSGCVNSPESTGK